MKLKSLQKLIQSLEWMPSLVENKPRIVRATNMIQSRLVLTHSINYHVLYTVNGPTKEGGE